MMSEPYRPTGGAGRAMPQRSGRGGPALRQKAGAGSEADKPADRWMVRRWAPIALIGAIALYGYSQGWHEPLTLSSLIRHRSHLVGMVNGHTLTAVLAYVAIYAVAVALSFPGASLITIAGGFLFGWLVGGTLTVFAATFGAMLIFLAARTSLGEALTRRSSPRLERLAEGFRADAFNYLLFLRLTPIFPFWLVNMAPALFRVPLRTYLLATFIGILPGTYAYSVVGAGLDSVIAVQEKAHPGCATAGSCNVDLSALITSELLISTAALGVVALLPVLARRLRRGRPGGDL